MRSISSSKPTTISKQQISGSNAGHVAFIIFTIHISVFLGGWVGCGGRKGRLPGDFQRQKSKEKIMGLSLWDVFFLSFCFRLIGDDGCIAGVVNLGRLCLLAAVSGSFGARAPPETPPHMNLFAVLDFCSPAKESL